MPILLPDTPWELIWELNKAIFVGEAVRITDLCPAFCSGSLHLNGHWEALYASPHPNGPTRVSPTDPSTNWDGLAGDIKGLITFFEVGWPRAKRRSIWGVGHSPPGAHASPTKCHIAPRGAKKGKGGVFR